MSSRLLIRKVQNLVVRSRSSFLENSMKLIKALLVLATVVAAPVAPAFAKQPVQIVGVSYGGNGCPTNSVTVEVGSDGQELSILFDKFIAQGNDPKNSRKSCNISIPIKVPPGFQISLYDADYRGYVEPDTQGTLRTEYFFAGNRGPVFERTFYGESNYIATDRPSTVASIWSGCGGNENMRVNASMTASGEGIATVDLLKAHRGLVYHLKYRACR
jgi:hypothetical protein